MGVLSNPLWINKMFSLRYGLNLALDDPLLSDSPLLFRTKRKLEFSFRSITRENHHFNHDQSWMGQVRYLCISINLTIKMDNWPKTKFNNELIVILIRIFCIWLYRHIRLHFEINAIRVQCEKTPFTKDLFLSFRPVKLYFGSTQHYQYVSW